MPGYVFNFSHLKDIYLEALLSPDKSLAFEVTIGNGRFLFMMFLSPEDKEKQDLLYVYMRNTSNIVKIKLYGSHRSGDFIAYISNHVKQSFVDELQLRPGAGTFDFMRFLEQINNAIPEKLPFSTKIRILRENRGIITAVGGVDEANKTVLLGPMHLKVRTPRDRTLRKLYTFTDGDRNDIKELIDLLKTLNITLQWTTPERAKHIVTVPQLILDIKKLYSK